MTFVDQPHELVVHPLLGLDRADPALDHPHDRIRDVAGLALGLEDRAATVTEPGAGALHQEQVREARHGDAEMGGGVVVAPHVVEHDAVASDRVERTRHVGHPEAGRHHDHVGIVVGAVDGANAVGRDLVDAVCHELDVRPQQRAVPAVVEQDPLAVRRVGRGAGGDQIGAVTELGLDVIDHLLTMALVDVVE